jgi:hypothetical protein
MLGMQGMTCLISGDFKTDAVKSTGWILVVGSFWCRRENRACVSSSAVIWSFSILTLCWGFLMYLHFSMLITICTKLLIKPAREYYGYWWCLATAHPKWPAELSADPYRQRWVVNFMLWPTKHQMKGPPVCISWVGCRVILDMMTKRKKTHTQIIQPVASHFTGLDFLPGNNNYRFECVCVCVWGGGIFVR